MIQVFDASKRILGVEHPPTLRAMSHLASTHNKLRKNTETDKLDIQVLGARSRILEVVRCLMHARMRIMSHAS